MAGRAVEPFAVDAENLPIVSVDVPRADVAHTARWRPEINSQCEMEHRQRWWRDGMCRMQFAVGTEIGRVRSAEMLAVEEMNAQMTSLVETLRVT